MPIRTLIIPGRNENSVVPFLKFDGQTTTRILIVQWRNGTFPPIGSQVFFSHLSSEEWPLFHLVDKTHTNQWSQEKKTARAKEIITDFSPNEHLKWGLGDWRGNWSLDKSSDCRARAASLFPKFPFSLSCLSNCKLEATFMVCRMPWAGFVWNIFIFSEMLVAVKSHKIPTCNHTNTWSWHTSAIKQKKKKKIMQKHTHTHTHTQILLKYDASCNFSAVTSPQSGQLCWQNKLQNSWVQVHDED